VGAEEALLDGVLDVDSVEHAGSGVVAEPPPEVEGQFVDVSVGALPDEEVALPGNGAIGMKPPEELLPEVEEADGAEVDAGADAEVAEAGVVAAALVGA